MNFVSHKQIDFSKNFIVKLPISSRTLLYSKIIQ